MIALLQRVTQASVTINSKQVAKISNGLVILLGIEKQDHQANADKLLKRVLNYRLFADDTDKMNLSLLQIKGEALIVPQFTLPADTQKGTRPSFSAAADPLLAQQLFNYFCQQAAHYPITIEQGQFAAEMQVALVNNGPVTFWLQVN